MVTVPDVLPVILKMPLVVFRKPRVSVSTPLNVKLPEPPNDPALLYWMFVFEPPGVPDPAEQFDHASCSDPFDDMHCVPVESVLGKSHVRLAVDAPPLKPA